MARVKLMTAGTRRVDRVEEHLESGLDMTFSR